MSRSSCLFLLLFFITACTNNDGDASASSVLSLPLFADISDSISKQPADDGLYFRRAVLLNKNNFPELALSDFKKAWSLKKNEQYALGVSSLLLETKPDSAAVFLKAALKELPQSFLLQISLARSYSEQDKLAEALDVYNNVLRDYPDQLNILMMKADLLKKTQDNKGLLATLEKAYTIAPSNKEISYNLAYQYAENKMARALTIADSLIKKDSLGMEAEPYYIKGYYYSGINEQEKAIHWFDETIRHDHRHLNAIIEKGKIYFDQKKIPAALKTFELANTISPAFPDAYYWIGRCQEVQGKKDEARLSYEKAFSLDKTFIEAKEAAAKLN